MYIEFTARQKDAQIVNPPDAPSFLCARRLSPPRCLPFPPCLILSLRRPPACALAVSISLQLSISSTTYAARP